MAVMVRSICGHEFMQVEPVEMSAERISVLRQKLDIADIFISELALLSPGTNKRGSLTVQIKSALKLYPIYKALVSTVNL